MAALASEANKGGTARLSSEALPEGRRYSTTKELMAQGSRYSPRRWGAFCLHGVDSQATIPCARCSGSLQKLKSPRRR